MNEIVNMIILYLKSIWNNTDLLIVLVDHLPKNKERIQKFKETGDTKYIYRNELDKACFQHDMAYGGFSNLARRTTSDKFLRDKAFNIAKYPKYDGYQKGLASVVYKLFDKKYKGGGVTTLANKFAIKIQITQNQQLAE